MKILITSIVDPASSAHSRMHEFAKYLSRRHDVTILSINDSWKRGQKSSSAYRDDWNRSAANIRLKYLTEDNLTLIRQEMSSKSLAKKSVKEFEEDGIDLILDYNTIRMGQNVAALLGGIPRIYDLADDLVDMIRISPQLSPITARIGALVSRHFIKSSIKKAYMVTGTTDALLNEYRVPETKRRILPNGVPADFLEPIQPSEIIDPRKDKSEFLIGYVGVLREWVDFSTVFKSVAELKDEFPIRLLIIGEEGGKNDLVMEARQLGIESSLTMTGTIAHEEIRNYLSACDAGIIPFVTTKTSEYAFPLKLMEYFSIGLPVISTRIREIEERFASEVLFYESTTSLKKIIAFLRDSPEERMKRGKEGREKIRNGYTWEKLLPKLDDLIYSLENQRKV